MQAYDDIGDKQHTLNHMYSHVTLQRAQMFVHVPCFHSRCWVVQKLRIHSHVAVVKQVCQQGVIPSRSGWIGLSIGQLRCDLLQELND